MVGLLGGFYVLWRCNALRWDVRDGDGFGSSLLLTSGFDGVPGVGQIDIYMRALNL
jgi:hypothetical protein